MDIALLKSDNINDISPLDQLRHLVADDLDKVDSNIFELVRSYADLIPKVSEHTISSGGKRLRPILTLACSKLCNYQGSAHIDLATAIEFIHTATLLHDDVVDTSSLRRGSKTANEIWGNKESILVGDFLLGRAFSLMGRANSLEVYKILSLASMVISEGEVMQLEIEAELEIEDQQYIAVITAKTAELFASACEVAAVISNQDSNVQKALRDYGLNMGIAFQIIDDVLDYWSGENVLGKDIGNDFKESKVTLPLLIAYRLADHGDKLFIENVIKSVNKTDDDLVKILNVLNRYNALNQSIEFAQKYINVARDSLIVFETSEIKTGLLELLRFITSRIS